MAAEVLEAAQDKVVDADMVHQDNTMEVSLLRMELESNNWLHMTQ